MFSFVLLFLEWKIELVQDYFFTYCVALHHTEENDTGITTVAMFCQKICLKNPYFGGHFEFPVPTGSSYYNQRYLCFR